ncbi:hypothetical protein D3P09_02330 [Paenibacillus pinisoli]|uniref:Uncharacterized protein n=1 Tax=Paenibacillus pinisoli TaxID=1276110 RepID=A0A3A6PVP8_9BACL|nr:hypothetical protein [Paenibacillus pinisoli]RJX40881.1 hypothetical protein D3P09_02330 [Paenibacillus pinisoli]
MPQRYKKEVYIDVIEFDNTPGNPQAIIDFTGYPIAIEYPGEVVQLRVIRGAYSVLVAKVGQLIVKEPSGQLRVCDRESIEAEYTPVD